MADNEAEGAPGTSAADTAPDTPAQPQIKMLVHFIRDLSFENVGAMQGIIGQGNPEVSVNVNLDGNSIGDDRYQVAMKINTTAKSEEGTRFIVELDYGAIFTINGAAEDHIHPLVFVECPRLLLPFARRVIADVTRDGGYPPLMIDNVDFATLYRQRLAQFRSEQQSETAPAAPNGSEPA